MVIDVDKITISVDGFHYLDYVLTSIYSDMLNEGLDPNSEEADSYLVVLGKIKEIVNG